jgi:glucan phosphorylase
MIETTDMEQRVTQQAALPAPLIPLERLAWNYWWSWAADGESVFRDLDSEIWEECEHNPRELLAKTSAYRLTEAATDPVYLERVRRIDARFQSYMAAAPHIQSEAITTQHPVAYFCSEFCVHY